MSDGFTLAKQSEVFKIHYTKKSENLYNSSTVLEGRIAKKYNFTGSKKTVLNPLSYSGGVGSGRLPKANAANYKQAEIESERVYATCEIERESIYASADDKGAFLRATAETVKKTVESYNRNVARIQFGDGSGVLGTGDATGADVVGLGTVASPYILQFPVSGWKEANWEEQDYVQMVVATAPEGGDTEVNLLLVQYVDVDNRKVHLVGTSARLAALVAGTSPLAATDEVCMQRSYNKDPMGLMGITNFSEAATGSLYAIPFQRRWSMTVQDKAGRGINPDMMNGIMLEIERKTGKVPNMIMTSYKQFQNILALLEEQKTYCLGNRNLKKGQNLKGQWGFDGVEFMSTRGPIGIFTDRFCEDDRVYFLNDNFIERHHRPGHGWFTDDKTVFLRLNDDDAYGARYGGYFQNYVPPTFHGCIKGLAV